MHNKGSRGRPHLFGRAGIVLTAVMALIFGLASNQTASADPGEGTGVMSLSKTASSSVVKPGETFTYTLAFTCSSVDDGCANAVLTDSIPLPLEVVPGPNNPAVTAAAKFGFDWDGAGAVAVAGSRKLTITFEDELPNSPGVLGLVAGRSGTVQIQVRFPANTPKTADGTSVSNTASLDSTNSPSQSATAPVAVNVVSVLAASDTKTWAPASAVYAPGASSDITLGAKNDSNVPASAITILEPSAGANPFNAVALTGLGAVVFPTGADRVQVDALVGGTWVTGTPAAAAALPAVALASVTGLRIIFTSSNGAIAAAGAAGSIVVNVAQRAVGVDGAVLSDGEAVTNTAQATVTTADGPADALPVTAPYTITALTASVQAKKSFDPIPALPDGTIPSSIAAGSSRGVTVTGTNTSSGNLQTLTISEPGSGNTFFDGTNVKLTNWGASTWPAGATSAAFTFNGASPVVSNTAGTFPAIPAGTTSFSVTFTGEIPSGAAATLKFGVVTGPNSGPPITDGPQAVKVYTNAVDVTGANAGGPAPVKTATADLAVKSPSIGVDLKKIATPSAVRPTARTVIQLPATVPAATTTVRPTQIVINEPQTVGASDFWNAFNAVSIAPTSVPAGATLKIEYYTAAGAPQLLTTVTGPQVFSAGLSSLLPANVLPSSLVGLRFTFEDLAGFAPSTKVQPNIGFRVRPALRNAPGTSTTVPTPAPAPKYTNCATATATDGTITAAASTSCTDISALFEGGSGTFPIDKDWDLPSSVPSRSGAKIGTMLSWGSDRDGLASVAISDPAGTTPGNTVSTAYEAFDLLKIDAISPTAAIVAPGKSSNAITTYGDPLIRWDAVSKVELFNGVAWTDVTSVACAVANSCNGKFPGYTLTPAQVASTTGVRVTFVENPNRAQELKNTTDVTAPEVGSGVSVGGNRPLHLTYQVRDTVRVSEPGRTDLAAGARLYNTSDKGLVNNTVGAVAVPADGSANIVGSESDSVLILDQPLTVKATKTATPGTLAIPALGTPAAAFPSSVFALTVKNTSPSRVDKLSVTDPIDGASPYNASNAFEKFTLTNIKATLPSGATLAASTVKLTYFDGTTNTVSLAAAQALSAAALQDVVGVSVSFAGRIDAAAAGVVSLTAQLRPTARSTAAVIAVVDSPITNTMTAQLDDAILEVRTLDLDKVADTASAQVTLTAASLQVVAGKTFTPDNTLAATPVSPIKVALQARSTGSASPKVLTLTDVSPEFWNTFNLQTLAITALPTGADQAQIDYQTKTTGAVWQIGAPAAAPVLPAGVGADVTGIRVTFSRSDGAAFLASANAIVTLDVVLRSQLRDASGPVLPGVTPNTVSVTATAGALTAPSAEATANFTLNAGTTSVAVFKDSVQQSAPGEEVPYSLIFKNTGTANIMNPVIVDTLPVGGLVYLPFRNPTLSTSMGGTLPTTLGVGGVAVNYTAATNKITFTFPAGAKMAPGETYKITVLVMVSPGLVLGTPIENSFGVKGDVPFAAATCKPLAPSTRPAALDADGFCTTTATLTTLKAGGLVTGKGVKAAANLGAQNVLNPATACTPDVDGYYRYPCAANSVVGGVDNWKLEVINGGNIPSDRLRFVDILPFANDKGVIATTPRGSTYRPAFNGNVSLMTDTLSAGTTYEWFYTTAATPCSLDLYLPNASTCPAGSWSPSASLVDPSTVTGLKFIFAFDNLPGATLPPGAALKVLFDTKNVPTGPGRASVAVSNAAQQAWNSFAVGGSFKEPNQEPTPRAPAEPNKAGVSLATGPIKVMKSVTGAAKDSAPTSFDATVTCKIDGLDVTFPAGTEKITLNAANQYTVRLDGIPVGAVCSVVEAGSTGKYGETTRTVSGPVTITMAGVTAEVPKSSDVTITNDYPAGKLIVSKEVVGSTSGVIFGPFTVEVSCTFNSVPVNTGVFVNGKFTFSIAGGASRSMVVPLGSSCVVTETGTDSAIGVSISVDGAKAVSGISAPVAVKTPVDHTAVITNDFGAGQLSVMKSVAGSGAGTYGTGTFTISVTCDFRGVNLYTGNLTVKGGETTLVPKTFPAGTKCAVVETDKGGANEATIDKPSVIITNSVTPILVDVTNTFNTGTVQVVKTRDGGGVANYGAGPFTVQVSCTYPVQGVTPNPTVALPNGGVLVLNKDNGYKATVSTGSGAFGIPQGATCSVTETATGGATSVLIGAPVIVVKDELSDLTVKNTFDVADLSIVKERVGDGVDIFGAGPFTVGVSCTYLVDGVVTSIDLGDKATLELNKDNKYAATIQGLLSGSLCKVVETDMGGATSSAITVSADGAQVPLPVAGVQVTSGTAVGVTVTNTFDVADLVITKVRQGEGAAEFGNVPFTVVLSCTYNGKAFDLGDRGTQVLSSENKYTATVSGLPVGTKCSVTETVNGGAVKTVITPNDGINASVGTATVSKDGAAVEVVNTFNVGRLQIDKVVDKPTRNAGENGTYTVRVTNIGDINGVNLLADDKLPEGTNYVSATGSPAVNGQTLTWKIASLPIGQSVEFTVVATFPKAGVYVNSFSVVKPQSFTTTDVLNACADNVARSCATVTVLEVVVENSTQALPTTATASVTPLPTSTSSAVPPRTGPPLAYTGIDVFGFGVAASLMLLAGVAFLLVAARRRKGEDGNGTHAA
ncbi:DUF5979 domain-containing protein [Nakamurella antarctica]|nr:DUF5979 domain-containing protein [Nakamurella antarctica]